MHLYDVDWNEVINSSFGVSGTMSGIIEKPYCTGPLAQFCCEFVYQAQYLSPTLVLCENCPKSDLLEGLANKLDVIVGIF